MQGKHRLPTRPWRRGRLHARRASGVTSAGIAPRVHAIEESKPTGRCRVGSMPPAGRCRLPGRCRAVDLPGAGAVDQLGRCGQPVNAAHPDLLAPGRCGAVDVATLDRRRHRLRFDRKPWGPPMPRMFTAPPGLRHEWESLKSCPWTRASWNRQNLNQPPPCRGSPAITSPFLRVSIFACQGGQGLAVRSSPKMDMPVPYGFPDWAAVIAVTLG